jgi:tRNA (guanine-N7-)-methyltransferase
MTTSGEENPRDRPIRTFGRTGGRPLSPRQQRLLETRLAEWQVPAPLSPGIDPRSLFGGAGDVWLEIGFGGGEHLVTQAAAHPGTGFIGCEPFIEGVAKALAGIEDAGLSNVRLWPDDARLLLEALAPASISRAFILFPDPWPKRRQQKRRLVQPAFLTLLHRVMTSGGRVRFATDVASYADEALLAFRAAGGFEWTAGRADDWRCPPADHVTTRYETKKLGDCAPIWYDFVCT